jgi:hypothetical protein
MGRAAYTELIGPICRENNGMPILDQGQVV